MQTQKLDGNLFSNAVDAYLIKIHMRLVPHCRTNGAINKREELRIDTLHCQSLYRKPVRLLRLITDVVVLVDISSPYVKNCHVLIILPIRTVRHSNTIIEM